MGLLQEKKKLMEKPLAFKNPNVSAIVGATKPIAGNSFMVKAEPVETAAIPRAYLGKRFKKAVA